MPRKQFRCSHISSVVLIVMIFSSLHAEFVGEGGYQLSSHTIDSGGGTSTGGTFEVAGTIGQHDAGGPMTGGTLEATVGFWASVGPTPITCPPDVAPPGGDGLVNVNDLLAVINGWGGCSVPCPPYCAADIIEDCEVNVNDLLAVINAWGACP